MNARSELGLGIVDAHQHFVDVERFQYYWMAAVPDLLHRSFEPRELGEELGRAGVAGTVAVQAHPSEAESLRLAELSASFPFIRGVIASIDLEATDLEATLRRYRALPRIVGVRHQRAEDRGPGYFLEPRVLRGLEAVERSGLVYDFLCRAPQLPTLAEIARRLPGLRIVLEHAGKPPIATHQLDAWSRALDPLQDAPGVACKLSELVTQADWSSWTPADLRPFIAHAVRVFGYGRLMWGSGWPICLLASSYQRTIAATLECLPGATPAELAQVFHGSAVAWYGLEVPSGAADGAREVPE